MDMSFSGLLTYFEDIVGCNPSIKLPEVETNDLEMERRKRKKVKKTINKYAIHFYTLEKLKRSLRMLMQLIYVLLFKKLFLQC